MSKPNQILISHSHRDDETALELCEALEDRGLACWIAPRDVPPGDSYAATNVDAIARSKTMLLLLSRSSNRSRHVVQEVELAFDKQLTIVPLVLDGTRMNNDLKYFLGTTQWVEASGNPIDRVAAGLAKMLDTDPPRATRKPRGSAGRSGVLETSSQQVVSSMLQEAAPSTGAARARGPMARLARRKGLSAAALLMVALLPAIALSHAADTRTATPSVPPIAAAITRPTLDTQASAPAGPILVADRMPTDVVAVTAPAKEMLQSVPRLTLEGVTWTRRSHGRDFEHSGALAYCSALPGNWRLPTTKELGRLRRVRRSEGAAVQAGDLVWSIEGDEIFDALCVTDR